MGLEYARSLLYRDGTPLIRPRTNTNIRSEMTECLCGSKDSVCINKVGEYGGICYSPHCCILKQVLTDLGVGEQ